LRLSQNFSFWESNLRFGGKSGLLAAFSKAIPKTNRVLGIALYSSYLVIDKSGNDLINNELSAVLDQGKEDILMIEF
jgi:hypothetical protein